MLLKLLQNMDDISCCLLYHWKCHATINSKTVSVKRVLYFVNQYYNSLPAYVCMIVAVFNISLIFSVKSTMTNRPRSSLQPNNIKPGKPTKTYAFYKIIIKPIWMYGIKLWGYSNHQIRKYCKYFNSKSSRSF